MKPILLLPALLFVAGTASAQANGATRPAAAPAPIRSGADLTWGPVPNALPPGAQIAVLEGNPFGAGVYTLRLKMPNGYTVAPHLHPTDEMVTVMSGTLLFGTGDAVAPTTATALHSGGFVTAGKQMHHYVVARGPTVVQVHGMGPFAITYVHPGDDPRGTTGGTR